ncbi:MAG: protein-S-isoprenylcysteine O-methyltransferase Ste14 [Planctomycetota bacterium]|jgi:protein-S-isoprenylcysteine O-methyltransferase Ste14
MSDDRPSSVPWPPLILAVIMIGGWALGRWAPLPWVAPETAAMLALVGKCMILLAVLVDLLTMGEMARVRTTVMPHRGASALVTRGPNRFSRNPIYVANIVIVLGLGLAWANPWWLLGALLTGPLIGRLAIRGEEMHLERQFGTQYTDYCKVVRRWL